jgi:hypothetical protein
MKYEIEKKGNRTTLSKTDLLKCKFEKENYSQHLLFIALKTQRIIFNFLRPKKGALDFYSKTSKILS